MSAAASAERTSTAVMVKSCIVRALRGGFVFRAPLAAWRVRQAASGFPDGHLTFSGVTRPPPVIIIRGDSPPHPDHPEGDPVMTHRRRAPDLLRQLTLFAAALVVLLVSQPSRAGEAEAVALDQR